MFFRNSGAYGATRVQLHSSVPLRFLAVLFSLYRFEGLGGPPFFCVWDPSKVRNSSEVVQVVP